MPKTSNVLRRCLILQGQFWRLQAMNRWAQAAGDQRATARSVSLRAIDTSRSVPGLGLAISSSAADIGVNRHPPPAPDQPWFVPRCYSFPFGQSGHDADNHIAHDAAGIKEWFHEAAPRHPIAYRRRVRCTSVLRTPSRAAYSLACQ